MNNIVVQALRAQLKVLDEEYRQNRKELLDAIQYHSGEFVSEVKDLPGLNGIAKISGTRIRSISDAVEVALQNISGEFDLKMVRNYIQEHFPDFYKSQKIKTINARIWEACNDPVGDFKIASPGRGGKSNIYIRKTESDEVDGSECPPRPDRIKRGDA